MCTKNIFFAVLFLSLSLIAITGNAQVLITKDAALENVFGKGSRVVTEKRGLSEPKLSKAKEMLGTVKTEFQPSYDFYFSTNGEKKTGVALILDEPGKWADIKLMIAMDMAGKVTRVDVMESEEKRGQPVGGRKFLGQFEGKTYKDKIQIKKDISGISGATVSSTAAATAVKKASVLYNLLYLTK